MFEEIKLIRKALVNSASLVSDPWVLTQLKESLEALDTVESELQDMTSDIAQLTFLVMESGY